MTVTIGIPYKSQAHFDIHSMCESFYFVIFGTNNIVKVYESDMDDLSNPQSMMIIEGKYKEDTSLVLSLGLSECEERRDKMIARPGYNETIVFDVQQVGPRIFSNFEIFTRVDKWRVLDWKEN